MRVAKNPHANMLMRAPTGDDSVQDVPVQRFLDQDGTPYFITRWEPSQEELAQLNSGGTVELWCKGGMVPVALQTAARDGGTH